MLRKVRTRTFVRGTLFFIKEDTNCVLTFNCVNKVTTREPLAGARVDLVYT